MHVWIIALYAAIAMFVQDVLVVLLVQAEARNRGLLAAWLDSAQWIAGIAITAISVTALQGHDFAEKVIVIVAVSIANFVGAYTGVELGARLVKEVPHVDASHGRPTERIRRHPVARVRDPLPDGRDGVNQDD